MRAADMDGPLEITPLGAQALIGEWVNTRFGAAVLADRRERAARVLEEAIELAQAEGLLIAEATHLVNVVYSRPVGEPTQEAAGVGVCLLAWAAGGGRSIWTLIEREIARIHSLPATHFRGRQARKARDGIAMAPTIHMS